MRAIQIVELTGPDTGLKLVDVPEPEASHMMTPGRGVVVEVKAAGVSFPEVLQSRGEYQVKPPLPFIPGSEVGGVVRSAPDGASVKAGDRVAAFCMLGGFAEVAVAPEVTCFVLPDSLDFEQGAALVRSDGPWKDQARELSDGGVDLVLDPVGGDRFTDSLRSLRETGRVVVVGFTGGSIPEVRVNRLLLNNTEVIGAGWGAYVLSKPDVTAEIGARLADLIEGGVIRPVVGARFPLEQASEALKLIDERGATGKVVLEVA